VLLWGKKSGPPLILKDCETRFLMRYLGTERIRHEDVAIPVRPKERVVVGTAVQEFVNDDPFVEDIDLDTLNRERGVVVLKFVRFGDDGLVPFEFKILLEDIKLSRRRNAFPVDDGDVRL